MTEEFIFPDCNRYFKKDLEKLRYKFSGVENIENNYSQAFQDMFALSILDGKKDGTYVEIGGDHGVIISNTYLLETQFNWNGVSFEIDQEKVNGYNSIRENKCICADAVAQLKVTTDATNLNIRSTPSTEGEFLVNLHIMK